MFSDCIFAIEINRNRTSSARGCCYYLVLFGKNPVFLSLPIWVMYSQNWVTGIGLCISSVPSTAAFSYNGMVVPPPLVNLSRYIIKFRAPASLMSGFSTLSSEWRRSVAWILAFEVLASGFLKRWSDIIYHNSLFPPCRDTFHLKIEALFKESYQLAAMYEFGYTRISRYISNSPFQVFWLSYPASLG